MAAVPGALRLVVDGRRLSTRGFTCSVCGEYHDALLLDIRLGLPDAVFELD